MKHRLQIRVSEELYELIKSESEKSNITMNDYICSTLSSNIKNTDSSIYTIEDENDCISLRIYGSAAATLRKRASLAGLPPSSFVRKKIIYEDLNEISVNINIEDSLLKWFYELTDKIKLAVFILQYGEDIPNKENAVKEINDHLAEITCEIKHFYKDFNSLKNRLWKKADREIKKGLRNGH